MTDQRLGFATRAVHTGQGPDPVTGAVVVPIHLATTYAQDDIAQSRAGFEYSRSGNPTRQALEENLCSLEGAAHALAFASGLAAESCALMVLSPGDHVVYMEDCYGGTFRLFDKVMRRYGIDFSPADLSNPAALEHALRPRTRLVWMETPTNPLLRIGDIAAVASICHAHDALLLVDNTFATPVLQRPLSLGADIVLHSATKYLGGHSDVVGGALLTSDTDLAERLRFHQNAMGGVPSPFDCWLLLRGIKTLDLRVRRQCQSAGQIAAWLAGDSRVARVHYPGLPGHPGHDTAANQMGGLFGAMISLDVAGGLDAARRLLGRLRLFTLAESLGAVESLAEHPALMTHASLSAEERLRIGVGEGLVRLSVGVEDLADLQADLDAALG